MSTRGFIAAVAASAVLVFAVPATAHAPSPATRGGEPAADAPDPAAASPPRPGHDEHAVPAPGPKPGRGAAPGATPDPAPAPQPSGEPSTEPGQAVETEGAGDPEQPGPPATGPHQQGPPVGGPAQPRQLGQAEGSPPAAGPPGATQQQPPAPQQAPGQSGCFLTSGGLACSGNPPCVITTAGVTCATDCTLTSAGLVCPTGGEVLPTESGGEVLPESPVSGHERPPAGRGEVGRERAVSPERAVSGPVVPGPRNEVAHTEEASGSELPFTGASVASAVAIGIALMAGGLLLRRRMSHAARANGSAGEPAPLAAAPEPPPAGGRPLRPALVVPALLLVTCGILLRARGSDR